MDGYWELERLNLLRRERSLAYAYTVRDEDFEIAKAKTKELVKVILELNADVNAANAFQGKTPFVTAITHSSADIVKMMMDHGADLELDNANGSVPLEKAFESGDKEKIDLFIGMLNTANVRQWHLLDKYLQSPNPEQEVLAKLVQLGADVNRLDGQGRSVLYRSIRMKNLDCLEFLIKAGADVNLGSTEHPSVLYHALLHQRTGAVEVLLRHGADPNCDEVPNLIIIALNFHFNGPLEIVKLLLRYGADINKHEDDESPLSVAFGLRPYWHVDVGKFLIRKIVLMKAQDFHVSDENLHASDNKGQFREYQKECMYQGNGTVEERKV